MSTNGNGGPTMDLEPVMNEELKKGHWTAAEDAKLMEHVRIHGEGNWNSVQKNTGLMRCGKSCRLRWTNNLRPDLKKGPFSPKEERIIINLHANLGNKWAKMASMLPGRTDNEIKNFWNTRSKRMQRLELPIYSQELHEHSTSFHPQHHHHQQVLQQKQPNSPQCSLLLSQKPAYNPSLPFPKTITFNSTFDPHHNNNQNSSFNPNLSLRMNNIDFDNKTTFGSLILGGQITGFVPELPSYPSSQISNSHLSFNPNDAVFVANNETKEPQSSGLLDSLLMESRSLVHKEQLNNEDSLGLFDKGKGKMQEEDEKGTNKRMKWSSTNSGVAFATNNSYDDITSSQSSIGMKPIEKAMEEMNSMDDDLLSLLDNFQSCTPLPEWYRASYWQSSGEVEAQQNDSLAAVDETQNVEWGLGFYSYKNNMPNFS